MAAWTLGMNKARLSGVWMPWHKPPKRQASRSNAARSAGFACVKECAGVGPTVGEPVMTRNSSQKNRGRQSLHGASRGLDDHLYR